MSIKPLGNRVLILMEEKKTKTQSGIIIPETANQEKTTEGIVAAVGTDEAITVKKGDKVIYDKYAGTQVKADDKEYLLVSMDDILAVVTE
ncbi:MAG: co-chaperone GroES [Spirochaetes bacterium GWF1_49_6]|jgi:chaperonin GroES|nr:MAG: co-chaperone GroES [Spirochaetes bacterium GWF1_49_6]